VQLCPQCGKENPDGFQFCGFCTAPLTAAPPPREQRKTVTVLFCDVTGSTALGGRLDPESLRRVMARYFESMRVVIERHGGTVEKFIGDAVMAVFGIPVLHEDDALRGLRAAAEMRTALAALNEELAATYGATIEIRIGVNTGEVVTGTAERLATGDAVNVAARLEQAAQPGEILVGEATMRLTRDAVVVEAIEPLELKGKSGRVAAYRLLSVTGEGPTRRLDVAMVGRERELRLLREVWGRAVSERACQLVTVLGSAGVGKSRLAYEFLDRLDGVTVVRGRCLSYGEGITYWPVVEIVKQLEARLSELVADDAVRNAVDALLGHANATASSQEIAWAVRKLLEAAAEEEPVVCVLDDVHWGEATFLDLLEHIADLSRNAPLLLLCMARTELLDRRPSWGGGKLNATTVLLEPLGPAETEMLVDELVESASVEESLRAHIREAAEGNPFFCEQMVAFVEASAGTDVTIPPTIQALLAARLDQLEPAERGVLERGSVEGRVFHLGAVSALAPDEPSVHEQVSSLVRKELVRPERPQLAGEDAFRFRHLLIRDAAYEGLAKSTRAELHEAFAGWLEEHGQDLVELDEILGFHLEQAYRIFAELGPLDEEKRDLGHRAAGYLAAAGRRAHARKDASAQVNLFGRVLALLPAADSDIDLELEYAEAVFDAVGPADGVDAATEAIRRARDRDDVRGELRARLTLVRHELSLAGVSSEDIEALARDALPVFEQAGDLAGLAAAWITIAMAAHQRCRFADEAVAAERALEYSARCGDPTGRQFAFHQASVARLFGPTPVEEALRWLDDRADLERTDPIVWSHRALLLGMLGRFDESRACYRKARARQEELGLRSWVATGAQARGRIELIAGDPEASERELREGCELLEQMGERGWQSTAACLLAKTLLESGQYEEADRWAERGRELGASDDAITQLLWREAKAAVLAHGGELAAAEALAREVVTLADETDHADARGDAYMTLGRVLELAGKRDEAIDAVEQALEIFRQKQSLVMAGWAEALLGELRLARL